MKSGQVKWVLLGAAVLIVALFLLAVAAVATYQLFIAPERTHSRSNTDLRHDPN
jgi:cytochrome c-type biogenesis protein CcmH/NrfG